MANERKAPWKRTNHADPSQLWGHELNIYQADTNLLILQIDTLYLIGMGNEQGNIVLPHQIACSADLDSAIFLADELLKPTPEQRRRDDGGN